MSASAPSDVAGRKALLLQLTTMLSSAQEEMANQQQREAEAELENQRLSTHVLRLQVERAGRRAQRGNRTSRQGSSVDRLLDGADQCVRHEAVLRTRLRAAEKEYTLLEQQLLHRQAPDRLAQVLLCPICMNNEHLVALLYIPCGHASCSECILKYAAISGRGSDQVLENDDSMMWDRPNDIPCPVCRTGVQNMVRLPLYEELSGVVNMLSADQLS